MEAVSGFIAGTKSVHKRQLRSSCPRKDIFEVINSEWGEFRIVEVFVRDNDRRERLLQIDQWRMQLG